MTYEGILYHVFGDESYDGDAAIVCAVSGLFGNEGTWASAVAAWNAITKGEEFHANEWSRRTEYGALCRVLRDSSLILFAVGMELVEYGTLFPNPVKQLPYYFCFYKVIEHMADVASNCIPRESVQFTFDLNLETRYNAGFLYDSLVRVPEFKHWELLADTIAFSNRKNAKIQMADLVAREVMNQLKSTVIGDIKPRTPCVASLVDSHRLYWHFYKRDYFEARVAQVQKLFDAGHPMGNFEGWRRQHHCQDTTENRLRYQIEVDKKLREADPGASTHL